MKRYPLIKVCLLFISGIILQKYLPISFNLLFLTLYILISCSFFLLFIKPAVSAIISTFIYITIILISALSYQFALQNLEPYPFSIPRIKEVEITGKIKSIDLKQDREIRLILISDSIKNKSYILDLKLSFLCKIRDDNSKRLDSLYEIIQPGNKIKLKGTISKGREKRNPWEFDYQKYLEKKGISGIFICSHISSCKITNSGSFWLNSLVFNIRKAIDNRISLLHSRESSALLRGLLLADRSEITDDVQTDFINSGVVHILAVSGSNVLLIVLIFTLLFGRLPVYAKTFFLISGLIFFLIISGITASVFRAVLMMIIVLFAQITNRSSNIYNAVFFSALIILLVDPLQLFDPGFQLSYAAVLSLIFISPRISGLIKNSSLYNKRLIRYFIVFTIATISAQIGTLPFTLFYFGKLSLAAILANIIIIPMIAIISASGVFSLAISIISIWVAGIYSSADNILTQITYSTAHYMSNSRYSFLFIRDFSLQDSIFFYCLLLIFFFFLNSFRGIRNKLIFLLTAAASLFALIPLDDRSLLPDGKLSIMAIDVGQGDASLIRFPNKMTMLIDAGEANMYFDNGDKVIMPLLNHIGIDTIDIGVISHIDSDHYSGFISLLKRGIIRKIYKPLTDSSNKKDTKLENFLQKLHVPIENFRKDIIKCRNSRVYVMNNKEWDRYKLSGNDKSGLLKITYGNTSFLFTGDAGKKVEGLLIQSYRNNLASDLLKLGHHGSKGSSSFNFLKKVNPKYGLISAGIQNRFNHPSPQVIAELDSLKIIPLRTDKNGAIIIVSDGENLELTDWKSRY